MSKVNRRVKVNLWLANQWVNLRVEQPALNGHFPHKHGLAGSLSSHTILSVSEKNLCTLVEQ